MPITSSSTAKQSSIIAPHIITSTLVFVSFTAQFSSAQSVAEYYLLSSVLNNGLIVVVLSLVVKATLGEKEWVGFS